MCGGFFYLHRYLYPAAKLRYEKEFGGELTITVKNIIVFALSDYAPVAQLDRVADFESEGCRFESCRAR